MKRILLIALVVISCSKKDTPPSPPPPIPIDPCEKANAGPDKLIRSGESVEIGLNNRVPNATYKWFPASGETPKVKVSPNSSTVYLLYVKTSCGISTDYVKVKVQ